MPLQKSIKSQDQLVEAKHSRSPYHIYLQYAYYGAVQSNLRSLCIPLDILLS